MKYCPRCRKRFKYVRGWMCPHCGLKLTLILIPFNGSDENEEES